MYRSTSPSDAECHRASRCSVRHNDVSENFSDSLKKWVRTKHRFSSACRTFFSWFMSISIYNKILSCAPRIDYVYVHLFIWSSQFIVNFLSANRCLIIDRAFDYTHIVGLNQVRFQPLTRFLINFCDIANKEIILMLILSTIKSTDVSKDQPSVAPMEWQFTALSINHVMFTHSQSAALDSIHIHRFCMQRHRHHSSTACHSPPSMHE